MVLLSVVRPSHALRFPWRSRSERLEFSIHRFLFAKIDLAGVANSHTRVTATHVVSARVIDASHASDTQEPHA